MDLKFLEKSHKEILLPNTRDQNDGIVILNGSAGSQSVEVNIRRFFASLRIIISHSEPDSG